MSPAVFKLFIRMVVAAMLACPFIGLAAAQDQQAKALPNSRVALVIGNSAYEHAAAIETATKDAAAMADSLTRLGFAVTNLTDADYDKMHRALLGFAQSARQASMAVIYFAGYGVEAKGEDYLVPIEADLQSDVEIGTISLHGLMSAVAEAKELGLVILEAGGGNSFAVASAASASNRTRSVGQGLAAVEPKDDNILVAFAARPGTTLVERGGPHSVFTEALLNNIEKPGLEIQYLFRNVEADVRDATDQEQDAAHYGSLSEKEIFLKPAETATNTIELASTGDPASAVGSGEDIAWIFLRESTDVASLRKFVERFPDGPHRAEASELITRLEQAAQTPAANSPNTAEIAWSILKDRPTAAGLERFVNAYRDSPHAQDALALLTNIEQGRQNKSRQTEKATPDIRLAVSHPVQKRRIVQRISRNDSNVEEAWQLVRTSRDPVVLRKFVADFPSRQYVSATHTRLAELGLDSGRPTNLSPQDAAAYSLAQCDKLAGGELASVSGDAVDACRQALAAHPDIPRLQFELCQCLIKDGRHQEASGHCGTATQMAEAKGDQTLAGQSHAIQSALLITDGGTANATSAGGGTNSGGLNAVANAPPAVAGSGITSAGGSGGGGGGQNGLGGATIKVPGSWPKTHAWKNHFHFFSSSHGTDGAGTNSSKGSGSNGTKVSHFRATNFRSTHVNGTNQNVHVTTPTVHFNTVTANVTPRTPTIRVRVPNIRVPTVNIH
jgi:hypothetical protein